MADGNVDFDYEVRSYVNKFILKTHLIKEFLQFTSKSKACKII